MAKNSDGWISNIITSGYWVCVKRNYCCVGKKGNMKEQMTMVPKAKNVRFVGNLSGFPLI